MPTDEQLLNDFYAGNAAALNQLFGRHERRLVGFLHLCVGDDEVASRLWDETMAEVYLTRRHPENHFDTTRGSVEGYLYAWAGNLALRWLRGLLDLS
jgi:DNA-directed RNA polymerase specialized sigma24 family protein